MRALQKICVCGNSAHVAIPKAALFWLGWLPGEQIILELTENKQVVLRRPGPNEFAPKRTASILLDSSLPGVAP